MLMGKMFTNITKQIRLIINKLRVLVSICNPGTQEAEAGRFEFTASLSPKTRKKKKKTQSQKAPSTLYDASIYILFWKRQNHREEHQPVVARGGGGSES